MTYQCRECKRQHNTVESRVHCQCGANLEESIRIADKQAEEERRDLESDQIHRGEAKLP